MGAAPSDDIPAGGRCGAGTRAFGYAWRVCSRCYAAPLLPLLGSAWSESLTTRERGGVRLTVSRSQELQTDRKGRSEGAIFHVSCRLELRPDERASAESIAPAARSVSSQTVAPSRREVRELSYHSRGLRLALPLCLSLCAQRGHRGTSTFGSVTELGELYHAGGRAEGWSSVIASSWVAGAYPERPNSK